MKRIALLRISVCIVYVVVVVMYMLYLLRALALTQTLGVPVRFLCVFFVCFPRFVALRFVCSPRVVYSLLTGTVWRNFQCW